MNIEYAVIITIFIFALAAAWAFRDRIRDYYLKNSEDNTNKLEDEYNKAKEDIIKLKEEKKKRDVIQKADKLKREVRGPSGFEKLVDGMGKIDVGKQEDSLFGDKPLIPDYKPKQKRRGKKNAKKH